MVVGGGSGDLREASASVSRSGKNIPPLEGELTHGGDQSTGWT